MVNGLIVETHDIIPEILSEKKKKNPESALINKQAGLLMSQSKYPNSNYSADCK